MCFYTWARIGLADAAGVNAILDTAGGEGIAGPPNRNGQSTRRPLTNN